MGTRRESRAIRPSNPGEWRRPRNGEIRPRARQENQSQDSGTPRSRIVIDTNRAIAAILTKGTSREILCNEHFNFVAPENFLEEMEKYRMSLWKRTGHSFSDFQSLFNALLHYTNIIPKSSYAPFLKKAGKLIEDPNDTPFLAVGLAMNAPIWTHDKHFKEQKRIKIVTNNDLL